MFIFKEWGSLPTKGKIFDAKTESGTSSLSISKVIDELLKHIHGGITAVRNLLTEKISPKFKTYTKTATEKLIVEGLIYLVKQTIKMFMYFFSK